MREKKKGLSDVRWLRNVLSSGTLSDKVAAHTLLVQVWVCLCLCLSVSVHLSVRPSVCLSVCLAGWLAGWLSVRPSVRSSVRLSVCLSICLSVHLSVCMSSRPCSSCSQESPVHSLSSLDWLLGLVAKQGGNVMKGLHAKRKGILAISE